MQAIVIVRLSLPHETLRCWVKEGVAQWCHPGFLLIAMQRKQGTSCNELTDPYIADMHITMLDKLSPAFGNPGQLQTTTRPGMPASCRSRSLARKQRHGRVWIVASPGVHAGLAIFVISRTPWAAQHQETTDGRLLSARRPAGSWLWDSLCRDSSARTSHPEHTELGPTGWASVLVACPPGNVGLRSTLNPPYRS
jgi:hypothetical protein